MQVSFQVYVTHYQFLFTGMRNHLLVDLGQPVSNFLAMIFHGFLFLQI